MSPDHNEHDKKNSAKNIVVKKKSPQLPTPEQLKKMSVSEIANLIRETRDYYWPDKPKEKKEREFLRKQSR